MRGILDAVPVPLVISRVSDGKVLYTNDHLAVLVGLSAKQLVGQQTPDFYGDPKDRERLLEAVYKHGYITDYELRLKDAAGNERWAVASVVQTRLGDEPVLVAGLNEITRRKTAERALSESEQRFRNLVEHANDIIYMLSPDGIMTYISPNWKDILGHDLSEVLGTSFAPLVHPDDLERCYAFLNAVVETGEKQSGVEYRVKHKDGRWRWHTSNASCLKDDEGNFESYIGIARDITDKKNARLALEKAHRELKEAQAQLVQSEKMAALGQLVAGIAHEINSPVGAISSMQDTLSHAVAKLQTALAEVAPEALEENRSVRAALGAILEADRVIGLGAERVSEIVKSLRTFVRLDEAEMKMANIHEGLDSALTLIGHDIGDRIEVERHYGELRPIVCHPGRLNQVFLNLLLNASQAIDGTGRIVIKTSEKKGEVRVAIRDTGRGIPATDIESIFEPRFTTKGARIGTGLGLSICYQIVQQHRGRIEVESQLGKGSVFTVVLPRHLEEGPVPDAR
jgi:PAS domain S-box-containing protein